MSSISSIQTAPKSHLQRLSRTLGRTLSRNLAIGVVTIASLTTQISPSQAADDQRIVTTMNGQAIKAVLAEEGYNKITVDKDDDVIFKMEGTQVILVTNKDSRSMTLAVSWRTQDVSLVKVNDWNRAALFSRAYLDKDNEPVLEMDLDMDGGVTIDRFKDFLNDAKSAIGRFKAEVL